MINFKPFLGIDFVFEQTRIKDKNDLLSEDIVSYKLSDIF
jgi:hypothetical protein